MVSRLKWFPELEVMSCRYLQGKVMKSESAALDFLSEEFQPELALASTMILLPVPDCRCLDNLSKCRILLDEPTTDLLGDRKVCEKASKSLDRRMQYMENKRKRLEKNQRGVAGWLSLQTSESFFERLANTLQKGPFQILFDCFRERSPIIVVTRSARSIRGTCTGILIGYDKHMNLILADVQEDYYSLREGKQLKRTIEQTFLKGDNVVSIRRASPR